MRKLQTATKKKLAPGFAPALAAPAPQLPARKSALEIFPHGEGDGQVVQGSPEWFAMHVGVPTASLFGTIMAGGRDGAESSGRRKLLYDMAGEILTGKPREGWSNAAMQRGKEMEADIRARYAFENDCEVDLIGFARNKLRRGQPIGCSPDGFVSGKRKAVEFKSIIPRLLMEQADRPGLPTEHRAQVHGTLLVLEIDEIDLVLGYSGMPYQLKYTVTRDDVFIREIERALEIFHYELAELVEKQRRRGGLPPRLLHKRDEEIPR